MVTAGETATFECELSYEGIAVEWFLGGQQLEASDRVRGGRGVGGGSTIFSVHVLMFRPETCWKFNK